MSDDHELRSRLERLASSAGDPPEHGLERIAARRHRRLHRRRGAVAAAAVLAVLTTTLSLLAGNRGDHHDTVTASDAVQPAGAPAEVPSVVEVRCEPAGVVVPVASVRPQRDGLHMRVVNLLAAPTVVTVDTDGWSSGPVVVAPDLTEVRMAVPPGVLSVGCDIAGRRDRRRVDLVDPAGYYRQPELACDESERTKVTDLPVSPARVSITEAARTGLAAYEPDRDVMGAPRGYPSARLSDPTADPVVAVTRHGQVVAFAHLRGAEGAAVPPWTTITELVACSETFAPRSPAGTTTTTASTLPPGPTPPV